MFVRSRLNSKKAFNEEQKQNVIKVRTLGSNGNNQICCSYDYSGLFFKKSILHLTQFNYVSVCGLGQTMQHYAYVRLEPTSEIGMI